MNLKPMSKAKEGALMNASRLVHRPVVVLLLVIFVSGLAWAAVDYFYQDANERAVAQSEYLIENERIDSLEALLARLTAIQFGGLPPMPGTEPWEHSEGPLPVDWQNFPQTLQDGLIGYWEGNVPVYEVFIYQDQQTREIIILNSDNVEIYSMDCPYEVYCRPETYALYLRPDLYSGKYSQQEIAAFIAERDPARVGLHVTLVPTANLFDCLYAQASQQSFLESLMDQGGGGQMMMSQSGGSGPLDDLDGDGIKPGSILVINDHASSTLSDSVTTIYTNTVLMDLVATNSPHSVTTDVNGVVSLSAPPRDYRIYGLTNSLPE